MKSLLLTGMFIFGLAGVNAEDKVLEQDCHAVACQYIEDMLAVFYDEDEEEAEGVADFFYNYAYSVCENN